MTEHPYGGSWGYQTVGYYAPTSRHGEPHEFAYFVDYCHRTARRDSGWVPAHFQRRARPAYFDAPICTSTPTRAKASTRGGTLIFTTGGTKCELSAGQRAVLAGEISHRRAEVDAVRSMLYLDYSRKEVSGAEHPRRA